MYYYVKTKNALLLYNKTTNDNYDTSHFYKQLENDIKEEEIYIKKHSKSLDKKTIDKVFKDKMHFREHLSYVIENIFIHKSKINSYKLLRSCFKKYIKGKTNKATYQIAQFIEKYDAPDYYPEWVLKEVYENLLSYGHRFENDKNDYQDLTLEELINKYSHLGSFDLRDKIHNYIRLALFENRQIDVQSIYLYWTKYYQRKDYSLYGLPIALKTLEVENLISLKECIVLINEIQDVSEKGYRHLLADFIELYPPYKIIPFLEAQFDVKELRIEWFKLPIKCIDKISERTYNIEKSRLLNYHRNSSIPLEEIENVLYSNKFNKLESTLDLLRIKVKYTKKQKRIILKFQQTKIRFTELAEQDNYGSDRQTRQRRLDNGILSFKDVSFIKKKKLKPDEIASYSDGYYTSLPDIEVFKIYESTLMKHHFKRILYNSLINKTKNINYFYALYYHPGNVLAMIKKYRSDKEFIKAVESFEIYMRLSMYLNFNVDIKSFKD